MLFTVRTSMVPQSQQVLRLVPLGHYPLVDGPSDDHTAEAKNEG